MFTNMHTQDHSQWFSLRAYLSALHLNFEVSHSIFQLFYLIFILLHLATKDTDLFCQ